MLARTIIRESKRAHVPYTNVGIKRGRSINRNSSLVASSTSEETLPIPPVSAADILESAVDADEKWSGKIPFPPES